MALSDPEWQYLVNAGKLVRCSRCKGRGKTQWISGNVCRWNTCTDCQGDGYVDPPFRFTTF